MAATVHLGTAASVVDLVVRGQVVTWTVGKRIEADDHIKALLDDAGADVHWDDAVLDRADELPVHDLPKRRGRPLLIR